MIMKHHWCWLVASLFLAAAPAARANSGAGAGSVHNCNEVLQSSKHSMGGIVDKDKEETCSVKLLVDPSKEELDVFFYYKSQPKYDSCASSFIKVYRVEDQSKMYHLCSAAEMKNLNVTTAETILIFATRSIIKVEYVYKDKKYDKSQEEFSNYLNKSECINQNKFVCAGSRKCASASEDGELAHLCNNTEILCIDQQHVCDGTFSCLESDTSDEEKCIYPYMSLGFSFLAVVSLVLSLSLCVFHHRNTLKTKNMVRYDGDVIKRKDLVKIKKNMK